jgi:hypothetical protein
MTFSRRLSATHCGTTSPFGPWIGARSARSIDAITRFSSAPTGGDDRVTEGPNLARSCGRGVTRRGGSWSLDRTSPASPVAGLARRRPRPSPAPPVAGPARRWPRPSPAPPVASRVRLGCARASGGAGDGNRTRVTSLEGWGSTVELRPRAVAVYRPGLRVPRALEIRRRRVSGKGDSNPRPPAPKAGALPLRYSPGRADPIAATRASRARSRTRARAGRRHVEPSRTRRPR